ncbi:MAG: RnfH family protein [Candidatus Competibacterales bacterium]|nr:RnfH family protein [Candidatus Competibacterales bacterium]
MRVEVAYARPDRQWLITIELPPGSTAAQALAHSGLLETLPEIDPVSAPLGLFGRRCAPDTVLQPGDRVEVYRPLQIDPKQARRRRARARNR